MDKNLLLYGSTFAVGGLLLYELYTGKAVVSGTRPITRQGNPFRYWFWMIFHGAIVAVLVFAWISGVDMN